MNIKHGKDGYFCCTLCPEKIVFKRPDGTTDVSKYKEIAYRLSDGSVTFPGFCPSCYKNNKENKSLFKDIMESIKHGWKMEIDTDPQPWKEADIKKYKDHYFNLEIVDFYHGTS